MVRTEENLGRGSNRENHVRLIGGIHRGRKLPVPNLPGLRPTGDRVRETLFNWLQPRLPGVACLDLFAGSGALGLEAASRGAGRVLMLDLAAPAVCQLRQNVALLSLGQVQVEQANAQDFLEGEAEPFDVVFLDPPFARDLLSDCCGLLQERDWLSDDARIYIEADGSSGLPKLPLNWRILRQKKAGQVAYYLVTNG